MPKIQGRQPWTFQGVTAPNTTQVPDQYLDELLPVLSGAELKVLLYITRRTFGFKKDSDNISLSQMLRGIKTRDGHVLDGGVGLTKKTLLKAIRSLQEKNIIFTKRRQSAEKGNEPTVYRLNIITPTIAGISTLPLGEKVHQGVGGEIPPSPRGNNYPIQQTVIQQTVIQQTDVVINALTNIKIEEEKAVALAAKYPPEHIEEKIAFLEWKTDMRTRGRPISDPAAWLIRAIEKDYKPPPEFRSQSQQMEVPDNDSSVGLENGDGGQGPVKELRLKYGTTQKEIDLWEQALGEIRGSTTRAAFVEWFSRTTLLSLNDHSALIGVPDQATQEWLSNRLAPAIQRAIEGVVEREVELEFVVVDSG